MSHFCEIVVQKDLENLVYFRKALKKNCPELFYATCTTTVESDMDTLLRKVVFFFRIW